MILERIIDSHMHLWDYNSGCYPWLLNKLPGGEKMIGNYDSIRRNYFVKDYKRAFDQNPIKKSVHIQCFGYPEHPVLETEWLQKQADESGYPHAIVGYVDFSDSDVDILLAKHKQYRNLRGIRSVLSYHDDPDLCMIKDKHIMQSSIWRDGYQLLGKYQLSFDVQLYDHQLDDLADLAESYPNIKIMINHMAWPTNFSQQGFLNWQDRIKSIARFKNVYMKISGIGCVFKCIEAKKIFPYVSTCIDYFDINHCVFGSNFPVLELFTNYNDLLLLYSELLADLDKTSLTKFFYNNAANFYNI